MTHSFYFIILLISLICSPLANAQFSNESGLSIVAASGNSNTETYNFTQLNSYGWGSNKLSLKGHYLKGRSSGTLSALNYDAGLRFERDLNSKFGYFTGYTYDVDRFVGYDPRHIADIGGKYSIIKESDLTWNSELGYRFMNENRFDLGTKKSSSLARAYSDVEKKWNESFSNKLWVEYLPNFTEKEDYMINGELSLLGQLNQVFSVKMGYLVKYRNQLISSSATRLDKLFTTGLIAKF